MRWNCGLGKYKKKGQLRMQSYSDVSPIIINGSYTQVSVIKTADNKGLRTIPGN